MHIDLYADVVCPWCYIGTTHLRQALAGLGDPVDVSVRVRSFQLDPSAPQQPRLLRETLGAKYGPDAVAQMTETVARRGAQAGIRIALDPATALSGSTAGAHRLLQAAWDADVQPDLADALYRAYFSDGRNIFDRGVLREIAGSAGLSAAEADGALDDEGYLERVLADQQQAQALGISGVPFFVIDERYGISGAQPVEVLRSALEQVRAAAPVG
jgi:predicted DsbA family dithiol-disulfide isomerase